MSNRKTVLVVGATGNVGFKVAKKLAARKDEFDVAALVREGSDASKLEALGVRIVRGDYLKLDSLMSAFQGVDVVVSCAASYMGRKSGDNDEGDRVGNANMAKAAKAAGVKRFVLNSILSCDKAPGVPHFESKRIAEQALRDEGVPFVALRPGAFIDQGNGSQEDAVRKNRFQWAGDANETRITWVYTEDLADSLVKAVTAPGVEGQIIDVGWTRAVTVQELADVVGKATNRTLSVWVVPYWAVRVLLTVGGVFKPVLADMRDMILFFREENGAKYRADTTKHEQLLGPVPTPEDAVKRWAEAEKLVA